LTGALTARAVTCINEGILIGSAENPAKIALRLQIPFDCKHPSEVKIVELSVDLGKLTITCFKILNRLPSSWQSAVLDLLSKTVSGFLKTFLDKMIKDTFRKALPWCSRK
jgi:hypothetical protein